MFFIETMLSLCFLLFFFLEKQPSFCFLLFLFLEKFLEKLPFFFVLFLFLEKFLEKQLPFFFLNLFLSLEKFLEKQPPFFFLLSSFSFFPELQQLDHPHEPLAVCGAHLDCIRFKLDEESS